MLSLYLWLFVSVLPVTLCTSPCLRLDASCLPLPQEAAELCSVELGLLRSRCKIFAGGAESKTTGGQSHLVRGARKTTCSSKIGKGGASSLFVLSLVSCTRVHSGLFSRSGGELVAGGRSIVDCCILLYLYLSIELLRIIEEYATQQKQWKLLNIRKRRISSVCNGRSSRLDHRTAVSTRAPVLVHTPSSTTAAQQCRYHSHWIGASTPSSIAS